MRTLIMLCVLVVAVGVADAQWFWQNPLPTGQSLSGVSFSDPNTGTAVGYGGTILRTTNGGASWESQSSGTTNTLLWSLLFRWQHRNDSGNRWHNPSHNQWWWNLDEPIERND